MTTHRDVIDPTAKPLNPQELGIAIRNNINEHREFIRSYTDPKIHGQEVAVVSYQFLEAPLMLPDNELFYGWIKVRGGHPSDAVARTYAEDMLKFEDSKSKNTLVPMGSWVALTSSKLLTKEFHELSDSEFRKGEEKRKVRQAEELRQIREREEKLKAGIEQYEEDSLDYYITQKVSLAENEYTLEQANNRVKEARKNIDTLRDRIEKLDKAHPEHKDMALGRYNKEREDAGLEPVRAFSHKHR